MCDGSYWDRTVARAALVMDWFYGNREVSRATVPKHRPCQVRGKAKTVQRQMPTAVVVVAVGEQIKFEI